MDPEDLLDVLAANGKRKEGSASALNAFRDLESSIRSLPKIDLHCHLSGCLRPATVLQRLPQSAGVKANLYPSGRPGSLTAFFRPWQSGLSRLPERSDDLSQYFREVAEDFAADGVRYAEVRLSLRRPTVIGLLPGYLDAVRSAIADSEARTGTRLRIVAGLARHGNVEYHDSLEVVNSMLTTAKRYRDVVVGFDIWGDEPEIDRRDLIKLLEVAHASKLPVTLHLGEQGENGAILKSLVEGQLIARVSHGPVVLEDPELLKAMAQQFVPTEVCMTSNWLTGTPLPRILEATKTLIDLGAPIALCTDNTIVCNSSLSSEYAKALAFGVMEVWTLPLVVGWAIDASFAPGREKERLREVVKQHCSNEWLKRVSELTDDVRSKMTTF